MTTTIAMEVAATFTIPTANFKDIPEHAFKYVRKGCRTAQQQHTLIWYRCGPNVVACPSKPSLPSAAPTRKAAALFS